VVECPSRQPHPLPQVRAPRVQGHAVHGDARGAEQLGARLHGHFAPEGVFHPRMHRLMRNETRGIQGS